MLSVSRGETSQSSPMKNSAICARGWITCFWMSMVNAFTCPSNSEAKALPLPETVELFVPVVPKANRSEEHTSELQSLRHLVCRLLLEKKKTERKRRYRYVVMTYDQNRQDDAWSV